MDRFGLAVLMLLFASAIGQAQLPSASAAALGMADNYTAVARGYSATAWNPAVLGLSGNPRTSLAVLPVRAIAGLDPVTLGDIAGYGGDFLPLPVRDAWLSRIEREGSEQGTGGGDVTWLAAQAGSFAIQASTMFRALGNLSPGAAELILFGNYGRADSARALDLGGSHASAFATSTIAVSYGRAVAAQMAVGVTLKYTAGHVLMHGRDRGTAFTEIPSATIDFPVVESRSDGISDVIAGGVGLDVGFAMERGPWTVSAAVHNVFDTFSWNEDDLMFRAGTGAFDIGTYVSDFGELPFASAPAHLQDFVDAAGFEPTIALGVARVVTERLTMAGDFRQRLADVSIEMAPATHLGAGIEYRALARVPLRAGLAYVDDGYQVAGGAGVDFGPVGVAASLMRRSTDLGVDTIVMVTLISTMSR